MESRTAGAEKESAGGEVFFLVDADEERRCSSDGGISLDFKSTKVECREGLMVETNSLPLPLDPSAIVRLSPSFLM